MFYSHEFFGNRVLQACLALVPFIYFIAFYNWTSAMLTTVDQVAALDYRCPAYFQNCEWLYFLRALPNGYSQTVFYMFLFGVLVWIVYLLTQQKWKEVAYVALIPYLWHALNVFVLSDMVHGNYEYYAFIFTTIILFLPHKEFFAKLALVMFYVLSTFAKVHPAWIAGGYFTSLQLGLPLFPEWSIPFWTNLVMVMEMVAAWFLLSKHPLLQRSVLVFYILFHLYSGILVEYRYPATVLPMILILFGPWYRWTPPPFTKRSLIGWALIVLLILAQLTPKMITGDEKLTLEGNHYGLYMFEGNHQCISNATYYYEDGQTYEDTDIGVSARNRCDPYRQWFKFNEICEHVTGVERIEWTFDHSINGDDFLRIVDLPDACSVEYHPFTHNEWIKTEADNPPAVGKPVQNVYY
jgi:hypothetical protein